LKWRGKANHTRGGERTPPQTSHGESPQVTHKRGEKHPLKEGQRVIKRKASSRVRGGERGRRSDGRAISTPLRGNNGGGKKKWRKSNRAGKREEKKPTPASFEKDVVAHHRETRRSVCVAEGKKVRKKR